MNEPQKSQLDFSLPAEKLSPSQNLQTPILIGIVVILLLNLLFTCIQLGKTKSLAVDEASRASELKTLALKLESQGFNQKAISLWKEYLPAQDSGSKASGWLRIGILHQSENQHEDALVAFYRSELHAGENPVSKDIGRRIQESLESLGNYGALQRELRSRVSLAPQDVSKENILAEIGDQKITESNLDLMIEDLVDEQIKLIGEYVNPNQKRKMLEQYATNDKKMKFLQEYIYKELLYRKAQENKLGASDEIRTKLSSIRKSLLAKAQEETEINSKVAITPKDISLFYDARKANFNEPATLSCNTLSFPKEASALVAIQRINEGEEWGSIAGDQSKEVILTSGKPYIEASLPAASLTPLFTLQAGEYNRTPLKSKKGFYIFKVQSSSPRRQKTLEEVESEIKEILKKQKTQELQEALVKSLIEEYDVVLNLSSLTNEE